MTALNQDLGNNINELKRRLNEQDSAGKQNQLHGTDVKDIRKELSRFCHFNVTQNVFADVTGFQPTIVKLWEAGLAEPNHRACSRLIEITKHPQRVLLTLQGKGYIKRIDK